MKSKPAQLPLLVNRSLSFKKRSLHAEDISACKGLGGLGIPPDVHTISIIRCSAQQLAEQTYHAGLVRHGADNDGADLPALEITCHLPSELRSQ